MLLYYVFTIEIHGLSVTGFPNYIGPILDALITRIPGNKEPLCRNAAVYAVIIIIIIIIITITITIIIIITIIITITIIIIIIITTTIIIIIIIIIISMGTNTQEQRNLHKPNTPSCLFTLSISAHSTPWFTIETATGILYLFIFGPKKSIFWRAVETKSEGPSKQVKHHEISSNIFVLCVGWWSYGVAKRIQQRKTCFINRCIW